MLTIKDIRDKDFSVVKRGYDEGEVDDFIDEIVDQLELIIRENRTLTEQLEQMKEAASRGSAAVVANAVPQPAPVQAPIGDEPSYFRNLETTLRETLINAQRIADDTVAEAKKKAKQTITSAEDQSAAITAAADAEVAEAKAELDKLHKAAEEYRARFIRLVQEQMNAIKEDSFDDL